MEVREEMSMVQFRSCSIFILTFWLLIGAGKVLAQSDLGRIAGTVTDPSGAVIGGAAVTASNIATGVVSKAQTGAGGNYSIPFLKPGNYQITVEQSGFKTYVQSGITVEIGQTVHQDVTLTLGQVNETVQVTGEGTQLQTETSDIGTVINSQQIEDLPLAGQSEVRTPAAFMILDSSTNARGTAMGFGPGGMREFDTTVAGGENATTEFDVEGARLVNGSSYFSANYATLGFPPDAVGEFKVMTLTPSAEYGGSAGGIVSFNYKSGTNQFHGSAYDYTRNDALNARGFYVPNRTANKQDEFGFVVGGPIRKDKTFAFGWYNGFRLDLGASNGLLSVPTTQMKQGNFTGYTDSSGNVIPIYDPTTTAPDGSGGYTRQQMSCNGVLNVMCSQQINKFAADLLPSWPAPTKSGLLSNYLALGSSRQKQVEWGLKIDHSFSAKNKIYGSFSLMNLTVPPGADFPGILATQTQGWTRERIFRFSDDYILGPNLVNHAVFGYSRSNGGGGGTSASTGWPGKVGFTGIPANAPDPQFYFTDESNVGGAGGFSWSPSNDFTFNDTLAWEKGKHSLKFGMQYIHFALNSFSSGNISGQNRFNTPETALPDAPAGAPGGSGFASFLFGWVDYATVSVNLQEEAERSGYWAGFVQDDWKVTRKLTINAGLRYDLAEPFVDAHNAQQWFSASALNSAAGNLPGAMVAASANDRNPASAFKKGFGPRLGLAYMLNDKTVIRASYGLLFGSGGANRTGYGQFTQGFSAQNNLYAGTGGVTPAYYLQDGWPSSKFALPPFTAQSAFLNGEVYELEPEDARPPYMQQWAFNIQRQLPGQLKLDVAYIGTKGTHLPSWVVPTDNMPPQYLAYGNLLQDPIGAAAAQALAPVQAFPVDPASGNHSPFAGFESVLGGNATLSQALRQYPQYNQVRRPPETAGDSTWNALRVNLNKRFSNGLTFLVSYTWSKDLSDSDSGQGDFESNIQDEWNRKLAKGLSENDIPSNLVVSYSYELPFGHGKRFANVGGAVGKIVGGWKIAAIQQYQSGQAESIWASSSTCRLESSYCGYSNVDAVPGAPIFTAAKTSSWGHGFDPNVDAYVNPAAFTAPAPYTFGSAEQSFGNARAPSYLNEDMSIWKNTQITERVRLEFHADFLNAFNRTKFDNGDSFGGSNYNVWVVGVPGLGMLTGQSNYPRNIQLGMKVVF